MLFNFHLLSFCSYDEQKKVTINTNDNIFNLITSPFASAIGYYLKAVGYIGMEKSVQKAGEGLISDSKGSYKSLFSNDNSEKVINRYD